MLKYEPQKRANIRRQIWKSRLGSICQASADRAQTRFFNLCLKFGPQKVWPEAGAIFPTMVLVLLFRRQRSEMGFPKIKFVILCHGAVAQSVERPSKVPVGCNYTTE